MKKIFLIISTFVSIIMCSISYAVTTSYGVVGDMGRWNSNSRMIRDSMLRLNVKNLIMPGDNLYKLKEGYAAVWAPWLSKGFVFSAVALGNHTLGYKQEVEFFKKPGEFYSFVDNDNDIRFIVLNSDNEKNVESQISFLKNELFNTKNKYNFIMYHHPSFTVSNIHKWEEKSKFQTAVRDVIKSNAGKISALIWGHDHIASVYDFNGVPVLLSGSSQDPRSGGDISIPPMPGYKFSRKWLATEVKPYWLKLDELGTANADIRLQFIRAEDDRVMWAGTL